MEEFGIGLPPRLFGKKIGETIYSVNLLPFGAFVKLLGESESIEDSRSFSRQAIWKRALIVLGGVISFWVVSAIIFSVVFIIGAPAAVDDDDLNLTNPKVQIAGIAPGSPAEISGLRAGDAVINIKNEQVPRKREQKLNIKINKVKEFQELVDANKGKEIILTIERGKEVFDIKLTPRASPPSGQGPLGISLVRTAVKSYPWHQAFWQGISQTFDLTIAIIKGYYDAITKLFQGAPTGVQLTGPIGIFSLIGQTSQLGASYFLNFIALISIYFAIFNILPIPALDGGKLLFLIIEAVRRKPVSEKIEQNITAVFFTLLIILMIWVTIKYDIGKLF